MRDKLIHGYTGGENLLTTEALRTQRNTERIILLCHS